MDNRLIGTIRLSGEASINFVNALFRPSREIIENHNKILDEIDSEVVIRRIDDGFEADIKDLDLSFLQDIEINNICVSTTIGLNTASEFSTAEKTIKHTSVGIKDIGTYVDITNDMYMCNAA